MKKLDMNSHGQYVEYNIKFPNIYVGDESSDNKLYYNEFFLV